MSATTPVLTPEKAALLRHIYTEAQRIYDDELAEWVADYVRLDEPAREAWKRAAGLQN